MKKYLLLAALCVPFFGLLGWTLALVQQTRNAPEVIVAIQGFDPRDLLSGHYIEYQINWEKTDCAQFDDNICPQQDFINNSERYWRRNVHRFYIPEKNAKKLDSLFRRGQNERTFEVVYAYIKNRQPIAKHLLIDGKDWREVIEK